MPLLTPITCWLPLVNTSSHKTSELFENQIFSYTFRSQNENFNIMLSDFRLKKVEKVFSFYDANNNGVLDLGDIDGICDHFAEQFGWTKGGERDSHFRMAFTFHWNKLIHVADDNNDGVVSKEEFIQHYTRALADDVGYYRYIKPFFDDIFPIIDSDDDGVLSKEDYQAFFRSYRNSQNEAEKAFEVMDINHDGVISHYELYTMYYNFHMSEDEGDASRNFFGPLD